MLTLSSGNKYYSEAEYNIWRTRYENIKEDFNTLSKAIYNEAKERNWCNEYNTFVQNVNEDLNLMELELLMKQFQVEVEFTRTQKVIGYIDIEASDEDEARLLVEDMDYESNLLEANIQEDEWNDDENDFSIENIEEQ